MMKDVLPLNKSNLIKNVAEKSGLNQDQARLAVEAVFSEITESLVRGEGFTLVGFGSFLISNRNARNGRNPQSGEPVKIPAKKVVKFRMGKYLDQSVNAKPVNSKSKKR